MKKKCELCGRLIIKKDGESFWHGKILCNECYNREKSIKNRHYKYKPSWLDKFLNEK